LKNTLQTCVANASSLVPETKGRTLEELDEVFASANPVKESLKSRKIALTADNTIVTSEEL